MVLSIHGSAGDHRFDDSGRVRSMGAEAQTSGTEGKLLILFRLNAGTSIRACFEGKTRLTEILFASITHHRQM